MEYPKKIRDRLNSAMKSIAKGVYNMRGHRIISRNVLCIIEEHPTLVTTTSKEGLKFLHCLLSLKSPRKNAAKKNLQRELKSAISKHLIRMGEKYQEKKISKRDLSEAWIDEAISLMRERDPGVKITDFHKIGMGHALVAIHLAKNDKQLLSHMKEIAEEFIKQHYPEQALLILSVLRTLFPRDDDCFHLINAVIKDIGKKHTLDDFLNISTKLIEEAIEETQENFTSNYDMLLFEMDSSYDHNVPRNVVKVLMTIFGEFQDFYEDMRRSRIEKVIPDTKCIRDQTLIRKFRNAEKKRGVVIYRKHAAHKVALDVIRCILIYVNGKYLTADDVKEIKKFINKEFNLEIVPQRKNLSDDKIQDNAIKRMIKEYLKYGCFTEETLKQLKLIWRRLMCVESIFDEEDCPVCISQRSWIMTEMFESIESLYMW